MQFVKRLAIAVAAALSLVSPAAAQTVLRSQTISYDNIAALEAVPFSRFQAGAAVIIADGGRAGTFIKVTTDQSALTTADTAKCVFVPSPQDTDGSSGGYMREEYLKNGAVNPRWCGAAGDGSTVDTTPLQAAFTLAAATTKRVDLASYDYAVGATVYTFTTSDWEVYGRGEGSSKITQTADVPTFVISTSGYLFRINFRNFEFSNTHATGTNSPAISVTDDAGVAGALRQSVFSHLRFRGHEYGILFSDTDKVDDGGGNISVGTGGYNQFLFLHVPQHSRYPNAVVRFEGVNGVDNSFLGGQYRSKNYAIWAGQCENLHTIGDMGIVGIRFVLGNAAVKLCGPPDSSYKSGITITGNQFDVQSVNTIDLENLAGLRVFTNASQFGVTARAVGLDLSRSTFETPDGVYIYGAYFPHVASAVNRPSLNGAVTGATPNIVATGSDTNISIGLGGQGTGGALIPYQRQNKWFFGGGTDDDSPFTAGASLVTLAPNGTEAAIDSRVASKGTSSLILQDSASRSIGFFNSAGQARPTISADNFGNPAVISLLQELEDFNLINDTSAAAEANRIIVNATLGSNYTVLANNTAEDVITSASVTIPVTGAYLIMSSLAVRHNQSASASDYSMRTLQDSTALCAHDHESRLGDASNDDFNLDAMCVAWLTAGTYTFKVQIVQTPLSTGATVFSNSVNARNSRLQIVRL